MCDRTYRPHGGTVFAASRQTERARDTRRSAAVKLNSAVPPVFTLDYIGSGRLPRPSIPNTSIRAR